MAGIEQHGGKSQKGQPVPAPISEKRPHDAPVCIARDAQPCGQRQQVRQSSQGQADEQKHWRIEKRGILDVRSGERLSLRPVMRLDRVNLLGCPAKASLEAVQKLTKSVPSGFPLGSRPRQDSAIQTAAITPVMANRMTQ
jgi:hypothetical protein